MDEARRRCRCHRFFCWQIPLAGVEGFELPHLLNGDHETINRKRNLPEKFGLLFHHKHSTTPGSDIRLSACSLRTSRIVFTAKAFSCWFTPTTCWPHATAVKPTSRDQPRSPYQASPRRGKLFKCSYLIFRMASSPVSICAVRPWGRSTTALWFWYQNSRPVLTPPAPGRRHQSAFLYTNGGAREGVLGNHPHQPCLTATLNPELPGIGY